MRDEVQRTFAETFAHVFDPDLRQELEEAEQANQAQTLKDEVGEMFNMLGLALGVNAKRPESGSASAADAEQSSDDEDEELDEVTQATVRKELSRLFEQRVQQFYKPVALAARELQEATRHEGVACDGCAVFPICGVRYKCTICGDIDLCEACEGAGWHSEHVLCKIRRPIQAPVKLLCQFKGTPAVDLADVIAQTQSQEQVEE